MLLVLILIYWKSKRIYSYGAFLYNHISVISLCYLHILTLFIDIVKIKFLSSSRNTFFIIVLIKKQVTVAINKLVNSIDIMIAFLEFSNQ